MLDDFKFLRKILRSTGYSLKKYASLLFENLIYKEMKLTGTVLYTVQKTKANKEYEILIHFIFRPRRI